MKTMGFPGYFLIVQDFIRAAREELGVSVGPGRGSAAGSAVAYCLGITRIDPIKYDLLFERFLNPDVFPSPISIPTSTMTPRGSTPLGNGKYGRTCSAYHHVWYDGDQIGHQGCRTCTEASACRIEPPRKTRSGQIPDMKKFKLKDAINYVPELKEAATGNDPLARDT